MQSNNDNLNQEVINFLRQDELDYPAGAARFGSAALPLLQELMKIVIETLGSCLTVRQSIDARESPLRC